MRVVTLEAVVEGGVIRLPSDARLPDHTKVSIVVPGMQVELMAWVASPRLARPKQAADLVLEVSEADGDAGV